MIWEASDPYLYVRSTVDGRVICGGEDENFRDEARRDELIESKSRTLSRKLGKLLPGVDTTAAFRWAGSFGQSESGLPSIGPVPGHRRCYAVLGFGGNGITFSMLAAGLLLACIDGRKDPDARLFQFGRNRD